MSQRDRIRLSDAEIRSYLQEGHNMTLVSNGKSGYPHPMPMFYAVDEELTVRFTTYGKSQKVANLRRDPRVALLIETGRDYSELKGLVIEGRAEVIDDLELAVETMLEVRRQRGQVAPSPSALSEEAKSKLVGKRVVIEVVPERFISWDHAKLQS